MAASVLPPAMQHQFSNGLPRHMSGQPQANGPSVSLMDTQKQRRISHPNLSAARASVDAIHQDMMPPRQRAASNAMPTQSEIFQNMAGMSGNGGVPAMMLPMPMQLQPEIQQIQQQFQQNPQIQPIQQRLPGTPQTVPVVPPFQDGVAHLTRHLQDMNLEPLPEHLPYFRRQSVPDPFAHRPLQRGLGLLDEFDEFEDDEFLRWQLQRGHRASAPMPVPYRRRQLRRRSFIDRFVPRRLQPGLDLLNEFDDFEFLRQLQRGHHASDPALMVPVPYYQPAHRDLNTNTPIVNNAMMNQAMINNAMVSNTMNNAMVNMMTCRPYSYETDLSPMAGIYPMINQDLQVLSTITQMQSTDGIAPLIDILVQRTPTEIDALRTQFRIMKGGADLSAAFKSVLDVSKEPQSVKYAIMGLVLGPVLFDLWLIRRLDRNHEDLLIDIFIDRDPQDMRFLLFKFQQLQNASMGGSGICSVLDEATSNDILRSALNIATENTRPDGTYPVDPALVRRDVEEIINITRAAFPSHTALFNILLRRSDNHLRQISIHYHIKGSRALDEDIRRSSAMPKIMRKIAVHVVRSAMDPTYRDVMALKDATLNEVELAVRICRVHWYKQHWMQVKAGYMGHAGKPLVDKVKGRRGLLKDVLVAMCSV